MDSVNEDLSIDPQKLTEELDDQMRIEDEKRRNMLLDKAKADAEKGNKPSMQNTENTK
jgi:ribosomal protein S6